MCRLILDRFGIKDAEIVAVGSEWLACRTCKAAGMDKYLHKFYITTCPVCGSYIPMPADFHSSVEWKDGDGIWKITLGRTVTQRSKPMDAVASVDPYYGMQKSGRAEFWPMFINLCYTLAPLIYAVVTKQNMAKFGPTYWRTFDIKRHDKWAKMLAKVVHPILRDFAGVITYKS